VSHHVVFTVAGTGSDMWNTAAPQPAGIAQQLEATFPDTYLWQPVGDYPAATFPMGDSVTDGINSLIYMITGEPVAGSNTTVPGPTYVENGLQLLGYSQGAIVVCGFIQWCFANNRMDVLERIVTVAVWGNPCRLPGFASGNDFAGWPDPGTVDGFETGGIAGPGTVGPGQMTPEQVLCQLPAALLATKKHYWGDFVNTIGDATDIYADCPTGPAPVTLAGEALPGSFETLIYDLVQEIGSADMPALIQAVQRLLGTGDLPDIIGVGEAVLNGGLFLAAGPDAAHYTYDPTPIYNFVAASGSETPPFGPV
jgi:hypothetical protein